MRVRALQLAYYRGQLFKPGQVIEVDGAELADLPRAFIEDRDRYPAGSPKRSAGFGWSTVEPHEPA